MTARDETIILRASIVYFATCAVVSVLASGGNTAMIWIAVGNLTTIVRALSFVIGVGAFLVCGASVLGRFDRSRLRSAGIVALSTTIFFAGFMQFKGAMPGITGFFADPMLAAADRLLHFGVDPWEIAHSIVKRLGALAPDANVASYIYVNLWMLLALAFPTLVFLFDPDRDRRRRYVVLYAIVWVLVGNILALSFLSGGPVFFEGLTGRNDFEGLTAALSSSGVSDSATGRIQEMLWHAHSQGLRGGTAISAFPSVHVGIATILALYSLERGWLLAVLGCSFLGAILFLSVYFGWHYAIDGYASILVVVICNRLLKKGVPRPAILSATANDAEWRPGLSRMEKGKA